MSRKALGNAATYALLVATPVLATAQRPVTASMIFPSDMGRTGVFRLPARSSGLQVQAQLVTAEGTAVSLRRCPPAWQSGDPTVLVIDRTADGSAWVTSLRDGITELRVSFPCATQLTLSTQVSVGSASIDRPFAPTPEGAPFYPDSLTVVPPGWTYVSGGKLYLRPIDSEVQLVAAVRNRAGSLITPQEFPMRWTVANPGVLRIDNQYDHTSFVTPVSTGTTTVTTAVEGLARSFEITVQDAHPATSDAHSTLALRSSATSATATVARLPTTGITARTAEPTATNAPMGPIQATVGVLPRSFTTPTMNVIGRAALSSHSLITPPINVIGQ